MHNLLFKCAYLKVIEKPFSRYGRLGFPWSGVCRTIHGPSRRTLCTAFDKDYSEERPISNEVKDKIFNTKLWEEDPDGTWARRKMRMRMEKAMERANEIRHGVKTHAPLSVKYLEDASKPKSLDMEVAQHSESVHFPFSDDFSPVQENLEKRPIRQKRRDIRNNVLRAKAFDDSSRRNLIVGNWLSDYESYKEVSNQEQSPTWEVHYGTPDPKVPVSKVSCGGCGAKLQCKAPSIPGYLPSEIFVGLTDDELKALVCQRCHFLKQYNIALDVSVSPEKYPEILSKLKSKSKRAMIILIVDLLDFPCSIWPGILDIIGSQQPVVVVGNKVDLIPGDQQGYLSHLERTLETYVEKIGIPKANIKLTALISARSGFGVEDLITKLNKLWEYKSDVYLVGCTNVGKSTLFNTLLQSDFCKVQAADLVRRATTSVWPGTTLNLLKFPILRPEGWRQEMRYARLRSQQASRKKEAELRKSQLGKRKLFHMPSLMEYVGKTFHGTEDAIETTDLFSLSGNTTSPEEGLKEVGIDEEAPEFAKGRWCYDTPGVMHPDQILNLLTTEELMKVHPSKSIQPRFFSMKPGKTLMLAGLGRIDFLEGTKDFSARFTVFSSDELPVTVTLTENADYVYKELIGTRALSVPCGGPDRFSQWPGLLAKDEVLHLKGYSYFESCGDIVLSSAGWVSVTAEEGAEVSFRVWTPHARGIYLRQPSLLPFAVNFKGKKVDHTPTYLQRYDDES